MDVIRLAGKPPKKPVPIGGGSGQVEPWGLPPGRIMSTWSDRLYYILGVVRSPAVAYAPAVA
jgi:hypothetical protein